MARADIGGEHLQFCESVTCGTAVEMPLHRMKISLQQSTNVSAVRKVFVGRMTSGLSVSSCQVGP